MKKVLIYRECKTCKGTGTEQGRTCYGSHGTEDWERECLTCKGTGKVSEIVWIEEVVE